MLDWIAVFLVRPFVYVVNYRYYFANIEEKWKSKNKILTFIRSFINLGLGHI